MKKSKLVLIALFFLAIGLQSCKEDPFARVTYTPVSTSVDGDVVGNGGSATNSYVWNNSLTTAELNMDITASSGGSLQIVVNDADGVQVINKTLTVGVGDDSATVCSQAGTAGDWTVTVTATDFNGDASFSLSQGC